MSSNPAPEFHTTRTLGTGQSNAGDGGADTPKPGKAPQVRQLQGVAKLNTLAEQLSSTNRSRGMEKHGQTPENQTEAFLRDLTEISHKHGIGITGSPTLFLLEHDDFALSYECDGESNLRLA